MIPSHLLLGKAEMLNFLTCQSFRLILKILSVRTIKYKAEISFFQSEWNFVSQILRSDTFRHHCKVLGEYKGFKNMPLLSAMKTWQIKLIIQPVGHLSISRELSNLSDKIHFHLCCGICLLADLHRHWNYCVITSTHLWQTIFDPRNAKIKLSVIVIKKQKQKQTNKKGVIVISLFLFFCFWMDFMFSLICEDKNNKELLDIRRANSGKWRKAWKSIGLDQ